MAADNRHSRPTARFDSRELAKLTESEIVSVSMNEVEDAVGEWEDEGEVASGTPMSEEPLTSRTATVDDPMTTGVLAEVARRPTIEVDKDWVLKDAVEPDDVAVIVDHPAPVEPPKR
jgi:hypothetical protein